MKKRPLCTGKSSNCEKRERRDTYKTQDYAKDYVNELFKYVHKNVHDSMLVFDYKVADWQSK